MNLFFLKRRKFTFSKEMEVRNCLFFLFTHYRGENYTMIYKKIGKEKNKKV